MYLEPHDYRIYYVNIDLRHQYGISVTELQTFLLAKRPISGDERGETSAVRRLVIGVLSVYGTLPNDYSQLSLRPLGPALSVCLREVSVL